MKIETKEKPEKYRHFITDIASLLETARRQSARSVNSIMVAAYWSIGQRIVEFEQQGERRAEYGEALLCRLSRDLIERFGRGFSVPNLERMRQFYHNYPPSKICSTVSNKLAIYKPRALKLHDLAIAFPLSWSHYVLVSGLKPGARTFYETEALRGGWSVRQLERQIDSQFYERTAWSKNKTAMLQKGAIRKPGDRMTAEQELKDPFVLEFLNLKDEYSESDVEEALIKHLETFLLELGSDFAFISRQKRLRIGNQWFRVDLIFYHRRLRCLVLIDLKLKKFTHSASGQMHMYLNYAKEHWTHPDENPPVGLILCAEKDNAVAHYALSGLSNKIMASEYQTTLPDPQLLEKELNRSRRSFTRRALNLNPRRRTSQKLL